MSREDIALAFRIPLSLLGLGGAPLGSTQVLMQTWIATGLGFCLNHVEQAFDRVFDLDGEPYEYVEFDTSSLLRTEFNERMNALARGIQGGIYSPNEARNIEGLESVKFGEEPRLQQQVVPLSAAAGISSQPGAAGGPSATGAGLPTGELGPPLPRIKPAPPAPPAAPKVLGARSPPPDVNTIQLDKREVYAAAARFDRHRFERRQRRIEHS
jgi:hypothetical protein